MPFPFRQALWLPVLFVSCNVPPGTQQAVPEREAQQRERQHLLERVDDTGVIQLYADGFDDLELRDKLLCYHLANAAIAGRDIFIDQKFAYSLAIRDLLEELYLHRATMSSTVATEIERYTKLFWLNNGIHDHLTTKKRLLNLSLSEYRTALDAAANGGAALPSADSVGELYAVMTDPNTFESCTNKSPENGLGPVEASSNNLYVGVTSGDLEGFSERFPLNSRVVMRGSRIVEEVYRAGDPRRAIPPGLYADQLREVNKHLTLALEVAPEDTKRVLELLIEYYKTGDPSDWHAANVAWVKDTQNSVDFVNGFVEVYLDARGMKGAWESVVSFVNPAKAVEIRELAREAQWFEDRMPWADEFRKASVTGITANAITVIMETGDSGPMSPIGINLPNEADIRRDHGSKSVNLANVVEGYNLASPGGGSAGEFSTSPEEVERARLYSARSGDVLTNLHEVVGHASGQLSEGITNPATQIGVYYSTLEEGRADLVGLYWMPDQKLRDMGIIANDDAALAAYESYARNALVQLRRVPRGGKIEEDHMRNRQMVIHWLLANTYSVVREQRDSKTYYRVTSMDAFRAGCGVLLSEIQRIKSTGDFEAAKQLIETYGVQVDPTLHEEILARIQALGLASSSGFVQPELTPVRGIDGAITDVQVSYPRSLEDQMLRWSGRRGR